jgi:hypothetical protein
VQTKSKGWTRRKNKGRDLWILRKSSKSEEAGSSGGGATVVVRSAAGEEIWPSNLMSRHSEECTGGNQIWAVRSERVDQQLDLEVSAWALTLWKCTG